MEIPKDLPPSSPPIWSKAQSLWLNNQKYLAAEFFFAGIIFDIITLKRIDQWLTIVQQGVFLTFTLALLILKTKDWQPPENWPKFGKKLWSYRLEALHFLFGSLLSAFTVFYFKSSSLVVSFGFLTILIALLIANELQKFRSLELSFKWALLSLCLLSYLSYLLPILFGFIGLTTFLASVVLTVAILAVVLHLFFKKIGSNQTKIKNKVVYPSVLVLSLFILAYWLQWIPPVPLSLKFVGIYHQVQKTPQGHYELHHQNPWWKFWHNGDQTFKAASGDKIYCYFRLFSPGGFNDEIRLHWLLKDPKRGWQSQDRIPIKVLGGRDEGFRGFGAKSNYTPGKWRVQVETTEGREIGRISFMVEPTSQSENRVFQIERQ